MLRTLHKISSSLLIALGIVHIALTPVFYGRFSLGAQWFAGAGLAIIFVGLLNITLSREGGRDRLVQICCYVANLLVARHTATAARARRPTPDGSSEHRVPEFETGPPTG